MRRVVLWSGLVSAFGLLACTSLLGDFEVSATSTTVDSGGAGDGSAADGDVPVTDGGTADADAGLPLLRCRISGQPTVIEKAPGTSFGQPLKAFRAGNQTRIVARKSNQQGFTIYTVNNGPGLQQTTVPVNGPVYDAQPIPGGIGVLAVDQSVAANTRMAIYKMPDTAQTTIAPDFVSDIVLGGANNASFAAFGNDDFYVTMTVGIDANNAEVRATRRTAVGAVNPWVTVARGKPDGETRIANIVKVNQRVFLFNDKGPEQNSTGAAGYFRVPETPNPTDGPTGVIPLTRDPKLPIAIFGVAGGPAGLRLAAAEVDFAGGTARMLAGGIPASDLDNPIDVSKLPTAYKLTSFFDAPVNGGETKWTGTDLVAVGAPIGGKGMNFYWYDALAASMRAVAIGPDTLLADRTIRQSTFAPRTLLGGIADIDLVWTEDGANGADGTLWTAQLACAR